MSNRTLTIFNLHTALRLKLITQKEFEVLFNKALNMKD